MMFFFMFSIDHIRARIFGIGSHLTEQSNYIYMYVHTPMQYIVIFAADRMTIYR